MRDSGDRVREKDSSADQLSEVNTASIGRLNVPQAVATAKTMRSFPEYDVSQAAPSTTWLLQGGLSKADWKALRALFAD